MASATSSTTTADGGASARFNTGYDPHVRDRYASRTVADSGLYLLPYLNSLSSSNTSKTSAGEKPGFTYLDVGCGPGSITLDFAQRFPSAFVVGIDPGESFIAAAASRAKELGVQNVLFVVGDVFALEGAVQKGLKEAGLEGKFGLENAGTSGIFDVVSCHQVLSHLAPSRRGKALANMHAVARRDGGIVAAREAEIEGLMSIHPETPLLSQWRTLFYSVLRATHLSNEPTNPGDGNAEGLEKKYPGLGSTFAGKHLLPIALSTNLWTREQIAVTGSLNSHSQQGEKDGWVASIAPMLEDQGSGWNKRAVEYLTSSPPSGAEGQDGKGMRGLTKEEALKMMRDIAGAWKDWAKDDGAWMGIGNCEIVCRR